MGEVVIDVQGMDKDRDEQYAEVIFINDWLEGEVVEGDNKNRDFNVSSFNSRLFSVIVDEEVDSCSGLKFLKNLSKM